MKRGSSAKFQKLGGAMAPAGPLPAPPLLVVSCMQYRSAVSFIYILMGVFVELIDGDAKV